MSQKEKQSELQVMQLVSSLIAGVLLAFGVSVVVLFVTAHLAAGGKIGTGAVGNAEVIASAWAASAAAATWRSAIASVSCSLGWPPACCTT